MINNQAKVSRQAGATMIEILIAVLVFSVGLLGIATSQTMGMINTQSSLNKSYAVQYAYDLMDIVRANKAVATSSSNNVFAQFSTISTDGARKEPTDGAVAVAGCSSAATGCTANQMALNELANWEKKIETLPDGQGSITLKNNIYQVVVTWADVKNSDEQTEKFKDTVTTNVAGETASEAKAAFYRFQMDFQVL